jgi:hypothetical protein
MNRIIKKIQSKLAKKEDILSELRDLSNSELNSFLLELFRLKSQDITPSELLNQFRNNRFVSPADIDIVKIKEIEIEWLKYAAENNFKTINLSPLAPFGSCSAVGLVNQNNVVSALRGTEIVSDATNILALKIANDSKETTDKRSIIRYSTTHRHVRGQYFTNPAFSAHFSVFCLASGGFDTGNYEFEISQLNEHIRILLNLLSRRFKDDQLFIKFYLKENSERLHSLLKNKQDLLFRTDKEILLKKDLDSKYYQAVQFKIGIKKDNQEIDLADGGDVSWTQKLLGNKKHRLFISGIGLDLMEKIYKSNTGHSRLN